MEQDDESLSSTIDHKINENKAYYSQVLEEVTWHTSHCQGTTWGSQEAGCRQRERQTLEFVSLLGPPVTCGWSALGVPGQGPAWSFQIRRVGFGELYSILSKGVHEHAGTRGRRVLGKSYQELLCLWKL